MHNSEAIATVVSPQIGRIWYFYIFVIQEFNQGSLLDLEEISYLRCLKQQKQIIGQVKFWNWRATHSTTYQIGCIWYFCIFVIREFYQESLLLELEDISHYICAAMLNIWDFLQQQRQIIGQCKFWYKLKTMESLYAPVTSLQYCVKVKSLYSKLLIAMGP